MIVALIPARGGSKRLPRKNVRHFAGLPLLHYSIAHALATARIDQCIVSTDDRETADLARASGAEVIERPAHLATDTATTVSVVQHVLEQLADRGTSVDAIVTLQPNCPLRPLSLLDDALDLFERHTPDAVISVTPTGTKRGSIEDGYFVPEYAPGTRSQDMPPSYLENGLVYVSRADLVATQGTLFGTRVVPLVVDQLFAFGDIDTELDFDIAEFLFLKYRELFGPGV